jgi:tetratricopeptide (TPR) repeat protein
MALIGLQFKILSAAKDYKNALKTGEEMVQMDTSLADVPYYQRMVGLYDADSQPQKAAEMAARATQKYPQDADLWQLYSATLKKAGQVQQSIAAAKRALEVNPQIANGWTQVAIAYNELNMPDSALIALRAAKAAGDNGDNIGQIALLIGNRLYPCGGRGLQQDRRGLPGGAAVPLLRRQRDRDQRRAAHQREAPHRRDALLHRAGHRRWTAGVEELRGGQDGAGGRGRVDDLRPAGRA